MAIRVLVVDDEPHARAGVIRLVNATPGFRAMGQCEDGRAAYATILAGGVDLVMLDVQMPGMSGLDVVRAVGPDAMPPVVFITAFDRYAVGAFEVAALDYILKPFTDGRFREAMQRARMAIRQGRFRAPLKRLLREVAPADVTASARLERASRARPDPRFVVRTAKGRLIVPAEDVDWISGADYYARLHVGGRAILVRESLTSIAARLPDSQFVRIHKSAIVNFDRVREVGRSGAKATLTLVDDTRILVSRAGAARLRSLLATRRG